MGGHSMGMLRNVHTGIQESGRKNVRRTLSEMFTDRSITGWARRHRQPLFCRPLMRKDNPGLAYATSGALGRSRKVLVGMVARGT
jgi:hypothetical protein